MYDCEELLETIGLKILEIEKKRTLHGIKHHSPDALLLKLVEFKKSLSGARHCIHLHQSCSKTSPDLVQDLVYYRDLVEKASDFLNQFY